MDGGQRVSRTERFQFACTHCGGGFHSHVALVEHDCEPGIHPPAGYADYQDARELLDEFVRWDCSHCDDGEWMEWTPGRRNARCPECGYTQGSDFKQEFGIARRAMTDGGQRSGHCAVCEDIVPVDGEQAAVMGGRVVCEDCRDEPVAFVAECLDCGWAYRSEWHEYERYVARQRVQQEANIHAAFEDRDHETAWREVEPETDGWGPDPGVVEGQEKIVTDGGRPEDGDVPLPVAIPKDVLMDSMQESDGTLCWNYRGIGRGWHARWDPDTGCYEVAITATVTEVGEEADGGLLIKCEAVEYWSFATLDYEMALPDRFTAPRVPMPTNIENTMFPSLEDDEPDNGPTEVRF
jgi:hypothetical protein